MFSFDVGKRQMGRTVFTCNHYNFGPRDHVNCRPKY